MTYKLIKEYPGSPKVGFKTPRYYCSSDLSAFPEFWEKVVEKDYEILAFRRGKSSAYAGTQFNLTPNGLYNPSFKESNLSLEHCLKGEFEIWKVKRLSDGEIFTIRDKVKGESCHIYTINSLSFEERYNNRLMINKVDMHLDDAKPIKKEKPLFTTKDGIDIFEGDEVWGVEVYSFKPFSDMVKKGNLFHTEKWTYGKFSTKEKAEEYILLNNPCLSFNDILKYLNQFDKNYGFEIKNYPDLLKLVKSKLNK